MSVQRQINVPTRMLSFDPGAESQSPKVSAAELQQIAKSIGRVQDKLDDGWTVQDFESARSGPDLYDRLDALTYERVFSGRGGAHQLVAELEHGQLVMQGGAHRVRAAQAEAVAEVPVVIRAPDEASLDRIERDIAAERSSTRHVQLQAHRSQHRPSYRIADPVQAAPTAARARTAGAVGVTATRGVAEANTAATKRTPDDVARSVGRAAPTDREPRQQNVGRERATEEARERLEGRGERFMDR